MIHALALFHFIGSINVTRTFAKRQSFSVRKEDRDWGEGGGGGNLAPPLRDLLGPPLQTDGQTHDRPRSGPVTKLFLV